MSLLDEPMAFFSLSLRKANTDRHKRNMQESCTSYSVNSSGTFSGSFVLGEDGDKNMIQINEMNKIKRRSEI